jgi:hypothetical protein
MKSISDLHQDPQLFSKPLFYYNEGILNNFAILYLLFINVFENLFIF